MPRGPSISTPPIFGSMAVRYRASFKSSAPTTAESGKWGVSVMFKSRSWSVITLWRGSLLPLGCVAVVKPENAVCLTEPGFLFWGCCAAQREQAPSPQISFAHRLTVFFYVQQQILQRLAVFTRLLPHPPLLRFEQALGHVAQGVGIVFANKLPGRRIKQIGVRQQRILVIVDQLRGGVERK